jgi:hypothetical protein
MNNVQHIHQFGGVNMRYCRCVWRNHVLNLTGSVFCLSLSKLRWEQIVLVVQWYLLRAAAQLAVKIALFVNGFVVYH